MGRMSVCFFGMDSQRSVTSRQFFFPSEYLCFALIWALSCDDVNVYMPPVTQTSRPQAKHVFSSSPETFMTSLETEVSMDEDRGSRKKGKAKGNAVLISHSDPNRPDIAAFERDYPFDAVFEAPIHSPCRPNIADSSIPRDPNHEDQRNCLSLFLEAPGEREEQFVRSVIDFTIDPVDKRYVS